MRQLSRSNIQDVILKLQLGAWVQSKYMNTHKYGRVRVMLYSDINPNYYIFSHTVFKHLLKEGFIELSHELDNVTKIYVTSKKFKEMYNE